jgi:hypothetical protein
MSFARHVGPNEEGLPQVMVIIEEQTYLACHNKGSQFDLAWLLPLGIGSCARQNSMYIMGCL